MDFTKEREIIEKDLKKALDKLTPKEDSSSIYDYAVIPPGKSFRPLLMKAIAKDLNPDINTRQSSNLSLASSSVEVHHAYTLVHDDLPCMDNDDERRGKPSTHKKYGEWQALLAGDGLLILSFQLLAKLDTPLLSEVLALYSHATGPKGLIKGQYLDLSETMNESFEKLIETHTLKTARLIQLSLLLGKILATESKDPSYKKVARLGHYIGVNFQLLDDLTELDRDQLSQHEQSVNPWLKENSKHQCKELLINQLEKTQSIINEMELVNTQAVLKEYYRKIETLLSKHASFIEKHANINLDPIMRLLNAL